MSAHRDIPCPACTGTGKAPQSAHRTCNVAPIEGEAVQATCWACQGAGHQEAFLTRLASGDFTQLEREPALGD